tara:strand:+ start:114 stop:443 length:330 start_codon:yes stop_codon:yes gene_type:complete
MNYTINHFKVGIDIEILELLTKGDTMSDYERKENTGALFNNATNKKTDKHPDYTGNCKVNGKEMNISAWINEAKSGNKYMSLKFDEYKPKTNETSQYTTTSTNDVEVPF